MRLTQSLTYSLVGKCVEILIDLVLRSFLNLSYCLISFLVYNRKYMRQTMNTF